MNNDMHIKAVFPGTGTSQGVPVIACLCEVCTSTDARDKRLRSSLLVVVNGQNIVIDAGPDFRQQMLRNQVDSLRAILLTHEHVDHIFGLDDIRAFNWVQKKPTDIYAEKRVTESIKRIFCYVFERDRYPGIPQMNLHVISEAPFFIDDIEIIPVRGFHHRLPVLGYRIGDLTYPTDISRIENSELEKIKGTKVLIINALRKERHLSHFSLAESLEIIGKVKPKQAYLTHISHTMGFHKKVNEELPPHVALAYDGLSLEV